MIFGAEKKARLDAFYSIFYDFGKNFSGTIQSGDLCDQLWREKETLKHMKNIIGLWILCFHGGRLGDLEWVSCPNTFISNDYELIRVVFKSPFPSL